MTKAKGTQAANLCLESKTPVRVKPQRLAHEVPVKELRAPLQVMRTTKQWLDQIIEEQKFKTYDDAIMFLITERQRNLPSDFGIFPDLKEYVCLGED